MAYKKIGVWAAGVAAVLVLLLVAALYAGRWWLLSTETGSRHLVTMIESQLKPALRIGGVRGTVTGGLRLRQVAYRDATGAYAAGQVEIVARLKLLPWPALQVRRLHAGDLDMTWLATAAEPAPALPDLGSAVPVRVADMTLTGIRIVLPEREQPLLLEHLSGRFSYGRELDIDSLELEAYQARITAAGRIDLAPTYQHRLALEAHGLGRELLPGLGRTRLRLDVRGDLDALQLRLDSLDGPALRLRAELSGLRQQPRWELSLESRGEPLRWPLAAAEPVEWQLDGLELHSSGFVDDYRLELDADVQQPEIAAGRWRLQLAGEREQLALESFEGGLLGGRLAADGSYRLSPLPGHGALQVRLDGLRPGELMEGEAGWPAIGGGFLLRVAGAGLQLEDLNLRAEGLPWRLEGNAAYNLDDGILDAGLQWASLDWPPGSGDDAALGSERGRLQLVGGIDELQAELEAELTGAGLPVMGARMEAVLGRTGASLQRLALKTMGGQIELSGSAAWEDGYRARLSVAAENIDPGRYYTAFPGRIGLSGELGFSAGPDLSQPELVLELAALDGELRGQPLSGSGHIRYAGNLLVSDGLALRLGDASLELSGNGQQFDAELDVPSAGQLYPALGGSIEASLQTRALPDRPLGLDRNRSRLRIRAGELGWREQRLGALELDADVALDEAGLLGQWTLDLRDYTSAGSRQIDTLRIELQSAAGGQRLDVRAGTPHGDLEGLVRGRPAANGPFIPWADAFTWSGTLEDLRLDIGDAGVWNQRQAAGIELGPHRQQLRETCLGGAGDSAGSSLCLSAGHRDVSGVPRLRLAAALDALPTALLTALTHSPVESDQTLSGKLNLIYAGGLRSLQSELSLSPGRIHIAGDREQGFRVNRAYARLALRGAMLTGNVDLAIEQGAMLHSDWQYGPLTADEPRLQGELRTEWPDLALLQRFLPVLDEIGGSLALNARFSGPLPQPLIALELDLGDASIHYRPLGARLTGIHLRGRSEPGETFVGAGGFRAGDGQAALELRLDPEARAADLRIDGQSLLLADSEALSLQVSPALALHAAPHDYRINGRLLVDRALLKPPEEATRRQVTESEDVVIASAAPKAEEPGSELPLHGHVRLELGPDVRVQASLASARLAGAVDLYWEGSLTPLGEGGIRLLDGRVQAYGQKLELQNSRVSWSRTPADNPRLGIYAVRRIFGDPRVSQAGVAVTGPARDPDISLFTNPASNEEDALAYIITGNNFDPNDREGALNLGVYLLPRLFVSYGVGLFDNGNTTNARFEFSDRWNVTLESGARDSAAQINWRKDGP